VTAREQLQLVVAGMSESEAEQALALVNGARPAAHRSTSTAPRWGTVLDGADLTALSATGTSTIKVPPGVPLRVDHG